MSAFLGPIHYWLYNKIKLQQDINEEIYTLGKQYGLTLKEDCQSKFGTFENAPLEEIIDESNIHGWLQERVSLVEYSYAYSVRELLKKDSQALVELKSILHRNGKEKGQQFIDAEFNAPNLFKYITDNLLDGMPCDHANSLVSQDDTEVTWKRNLCVHEDYWFEVGGNPIYYYELRDAWIEGFTSVCGLTFHKIDDNTYQIKKGE